MSRGTGTRSGGGGQDPLPASAFGTLIFKQHLLWAWPAKRVPGSLFTDKDTEVPEAHSPAHLPSYLAHRIHFLC